MRNRGWPPTEALALMAMPPANRCYPRGADRFVGRDYMMVICESDAEAIRAVTLTYDYTVHNYLKKGE